MDLMHLKEVFRTASLEAVALRLLDLSEPSLVTIVENGRVGLRRANRFRAPRELLEVERQVLRDVHAHSRPYWARGGGWQAWGWPDHQVDWKREVLRSVPDEEVM
jgi:hypothetical protein